MDTQKDANTFNASLSELEAIRKFIASAAEKLHVEKSAMEDLQMAADEAVTNIIQHGYGSKPGKITIVISRTGDEFFVSIIDDAPPFDIFSRKKSDLKISPLEREKPGGYGVDLIYQLTDRIEQNILENGQNELSLIKSI